MMRWMEKEEEAVPQSAAEKSESVAIFAIMSLDISYDVLFDKLDVEHHTFSSFSSLSPN